MGYRDEGEAAMNRVQNLQSENDELKTQLESANADLAKANAEIVRLRGQPIPPRDTGAMKPINGIIIRVWLGLAIAALLPLAVAAYQSETKGVRMALLVIPVWGGLLGAARYKRRGVLGQLVGGVIFTFLTFVVVLGFFSTLWRSL